MNKQFVVKCEKLLFLFTSLSIILKSENETNWSLGVNNIISQLTPPNYGELLDPYKAFQSVSSMYRLMEGGYGSFSDFYVWREDFDTRKKLNEELNMIKEKIWFTLND
ncbi:hypothetical protein [Thorsellia anophelis]|uniref:Uncharacterized protein n=1 Tax=Thorsellia anophelis DSM 18579 TaxID=1123402 RepID=A0A1I0CIK0_9GAMM|nr:hypothetical protein [Thorsellia anophelis]SET18970.1 hypothetical protein SAMN02583745_01611 [Thorsellia anophelis DSM 18579]